VAARAVGQRRDAAPGTRSAPTPDGIAAAWATEWDTLDAWLDSLSDGWLEQRDDNIPFWQMLAHVVNHGTQHRAEAAALLTQAGRSPGDLDMIFFAAELAHP
jgi:uncharacterized damage-inducible protein DinB